MTTPDRTQRIEELFHACLERDGNHRKQFLLDSCGGDEGLRLEVEELLHSHEEPDSFLDSPLTITDLPPETATLIQKEALPTVSSRYQMVSLLGKGGMGEVYLAKDISLGRKVALKILPSRFSSEPDHLQRFEREAKAASALNHPNILTVYEFGQAEDSRFIATEFIEGETLRKRLSRGRLSLPESLAIIVQVADALGAAHAAGIIHRDIKPENIMLRPDGYVKVLDFGLAKLTEPSPDTGDSPTLTGMVMGTPAYMSPEQVRGQKVDVRSDVWSLGAVFYEMVSGERAFRGASEGDTFVAILDREPKSLTGRVPPDIARIISTTLVKDPGGRYSAISEFARETKEAQRRLESGRDLSVSETDTVPWQAVGAADTQPAPPGASETTSFESGPPGGLVPGTELRKGRMPIYLALAFLVLGASGGLWYLTQSVKQPVPVSPQPEVLKPEREFTWWLNVQRSRSDNSKPFKSSGRDWFPNGSRFSFSFTSGQEGYLYLLNEGPAAGGAITLNLLLPNPAAAGRNRNAAISKDQMVETGTYLFNEYEGEEKFWIVWSASPVEEIEAVKDQAGTEIKEITKAAAILALLNRQAPQSVSATDDEKEKTTVTSREKLAVSLVKLKHRN